LIAADARLVEDAFQATLASFGTTADIGDAPLRGDDYDDRMTTITMSGVMAR